MNSQLQNFSSKNKAFSLVEVLIAVLILSIGIVGSLKLNVSSFFSSRKSLLLSRKVELATQVVEKIAAVKYDEIEDACSEETGTVIMDGKVYYISCYVVSVDASFLKMIVVSVSSNIGSTYNVVFYRISP